MTDLEILKKILNQETEAEKRYIEQINKIRTPIIRKVLKDIRLEEYRHKRELIVILKNMEDHFDDKPYAEVEKIMPEEPGSEDFRLVQALLELDKEKEAEAATLYLESSEKAEDPKLRDLFLEFLNQEKAHEKKIKTLIDQLNLFNR
ncbi:MAG: ferritin-like domain-containing protein [Candidatus Nanoarchaeia archaeon]|nr:ferritin-like domain-containing protein [Candidatus Nanoarchaeia archaeon]